MPAKGQDTMHDPIFLASLIGPVAARRSAWRAGQRPRLSARWPTNSWHSPALIFISGLFTLAAGLAIVLNHNVWTADWRVLITLLGWLGIIGGLIRILLPQQVIAIGNVDVRPPRPSPQSPPPSFWPAPVLPAFSAISPERASTEQDHEQNRLRRRSGHPKVTTGPLPASRKVYRRPTPRRSCACRCARSCSSRAPRSRTSRSTGHDRRLFTIRTR